VQYVICYDIADDGRRNRVAQALLNFGKREQESVFVAYLDDELAGRMKERMAELVDTNWDRVHIFELCEACGRRGTVIGAGEVAAEPAWYII
jgi:CRISPR-associated protein Cas2